jgi:hypothetical protein
MEAKIIVMIVTLAMPDGKSSVSVKPMTTVDSCRVEAQIEASDPFVAGVECSELLDGKLELKFKRTDRSGSTGSKRKIPEAAMDGSTG